MKTENYNSKLAFEHIRTIKKRLKAYEELAKKEDVQLEDLAVLEGVNSRLWAAATTARSAMSQARSADAKGRRKAFAKKRRAERPVWFMG